MPWRRVAIYGAVAAAWVAANLAALAGIAFYESRKLEQEFGVPPNVIPRSTGVRWRSLARKPSRSNSGIGFTLLPAGNPPVERVA